LQQPDHVEVNGVRARWLVAADGLRSPIRRQLGLELPPRRPARVGLRRHFHCEGVPDRVEVHWAEEGEAYVTPVAPDLVGVALLVPAGAVPTASLAGDKKEGTGAKEPLFDRWLECFPALRERLGAPAGEVRGAGPFEQRVRRRVAGRVLLVGDAAGFLDPITGEGIRLGLHAAEVLVRCLTNGTPAAYDRAWRRLARRYWLCTAALLWIRRRRTLRRRMVPLLHRCPWLFDRALGLLTGG
jgi:flavin-dependent dehydrogenase